MYIFFLIFIGFYTGIAAQGAWTEISRSEPVPADVQLLHSDLGQTSIQFTLEGFMQNGLQTPKGREYQIAVGGGVQILEKGMPDLAKLAVNIIIPDQDDMDIQVVRSEYVKFKDIPVGPSKGHFTRDINPDDVPFTYGEVYETDAFWPGKLAQLEDPFIMRDFRGQTVTIFPFQYNPAEQTLKVYTEIEVEITATGEKGKDPLYRTREEIVLEPEFKQIYNRFFLNMQSAEKSYPLLDGEEGSMLIIAYDDFMDAMQPLVDWKRTTGRRTEIVPLSDIGSSSGDIKSFVDNYYQNNDDFAHLLLVGDGPQIPPMVTSNGDSDNAYGFIEGTNSFNDIFVGRFSAESVAHVETQVQRTIEYERDLNESDTWLNRALGVARNEGAGSGHHGEADHQHMNFIRDTLLNFTYDVVHQRYDGTGFSTSAAEISADINAGVSAINFCNHGSVTGWSVAGYNISHVNALNNAGRLPYLTNVACVNGDFVTNFCFAEAWMRATNADGEPTGTVANMSATINQPWQPPMCGQDEMVSIKTEASIQHGSVIRRTYGGISINGSMFMIPQYGSQGIRTHETWVLFGDPSLMVRTDVPEVLMPSYNPVTFIGFDQFELTLPDADGATVALTYYDETEEEVVIMGTAIVEDGTATVNFDNPPDQPMDMTLTITGFNKVTYMNEEIQVIPPEGPYVILSDFVIDDSEGNNNNQADYGETISLDVVLENVGIESSPNVEAEITTNSEHVTITDNHAVWGDIDEGENVMVETSFSFIVNEMIPNDQPVQFTLHISDADDNEWESNLILRIYSPEFLISELWVDDSEHGDGDGLLDPGETANVMVTYTNEGGAPAMAPVSRFSAQSPYLSIIDGEIEHAVIPAGDEVTVAYEVEAHPATTDGTLLNVFFLIEDGHVFNSEQEIVIGQLPEMTIGEGTEQSNQYPFYNYYRANRSQMIYTQSELGAGEKSIIELAYEIIHASSSHNELPNFEIRMIHTTANTLSAFQTTTASDVVYSANPHVMPLSTGWHNWELDEPFEYNGVDNLLVEIVWGRLPNWTTTWYRVASTNVGANRVAYGFSDQVDIPSYSGNSTVRPNIWLDFATEASEDEKKLDFVVTDNQDNHLQDAGITIGSLTKYTDMHGEVSFDLMPGQYHFLAEKEDYVPVEDQVDLQSDMEIPVVLMSDAIIPGDANGDGIVNFIDVMTIVQYFQGENPEPFYFENADVNQDGIINLLDVIATANIFADGKASPRPEMQSRPADLHMHHDGISLHSDGTLTGIQFELATKGQFHDMQLLLPDHELVLVHEEESLRAMVYSAVNTPIPKGEIKIISFVPRGKLPEWTDAFGGNLNADKVPVTTHQDETTGIAGQGGEMAFHAYPNPAREKLWVEFVSQGTEPVKVRLVNVHGQTMQTKHVSSEGPVTMSFSLEGYAPGLYMIRIDSQEKSLLEKIMVE